MFDAYDTFRLARMIPQQPIPVGSVGVVLMVFDGSIPEYEVEFPDGKGGNLGTRPTHTIREEFMEPFTPEDTESKLAT
jgi:hypothetical protein